MPSRSRKKIRTEAGAGEVYVDDSAEGGLSSNDQI